MSDDQRPPPHQHPPPGGAVGGSPECAVCPLCVLLQALSASRPEVTEHLLAAARELTLALQAVVDAGARAQEGASEGLERIDVE